MPIIKKFFTALGHLISGKKKLARRKKSTPRKTKNSKKVKKPVRRKRAVKRAKRVKSFRGAKRTVRSKARKARKVKGGKKSTAVKRRKPQKKKIQRKLRKTVKKRPVKKKKPRGTRPGGGRKGPLHTKGKQKPDTSFQGVLIGEITHYFTKIRVCVLKVTHHPVKVGDLIEIRGKSPAFKQKVKSLQIESVDVLSARKGHLVGLKVEKKARVGDKAYRL